MPAPCGAMTCIIIADTCYLLGGNDTDGKGLATVLYAPLTSLIQKATSPTHQSAINTSVWKTLPDTPLKEFTPVSLSGHLVTVGGYKGKTSTAALVVRILAAKIGIALPVVPEVHAFFPDTNFWVRLMIAELPVPLFGCAAAQLSPNTMIVIGGCDTHFNYLKTVLMATVTV